MTAEMLARIGAVVALLGYGAFLMILAVTMPEGLGLIGWLVLIVPCVLYLILIALIRTVFFD